MKLMATKYFEGFGLGLLVNVVVIAVVQFLRGADYLGPTSEAVANAELVRLVTLAVTAYIFDYVWSFSILKYAEGRVGLLFYLLLHGLVIFVLWSVIPHLAYIVVGLVTLVLWIVANRISPKEKES